MTPLSSRYALPLLILLTLAVVPVGIHSYIGVRADDCANPEAVREVSEVARSRLGREHPERYQLGRFQWTEGFVATGGSGLRESCAKGRLAAPS